AKTDFISIAAHELKTPLTVVQGYIDMLVESAGPERNAQLLDRIAGGTARLAAIVNDLLDVSAIETGSLDVRFEPVMVDSIVKLLLDQKTAATQSRRLTLRAELEPELPVIYSDPRRLHQILERLAGNAIKYTPDGGTITITAGLESGGGDDAPWVKLEVADTGIGIAPEDRDHIFDKFYRVGQTELHSTGRVKFKGAGPGLGLSIAKGIVEALNGQLWVESPGYDEVNCPGSTFYLRLPAGEPPDDAPSS
ncbi:MAG: sensor histidine kinase, partial [Anaerolineae bacterium]